MRIRIRQKNIYLIGYANYYRYIFFQALMLISQDISCGYLKKIMAIGDVEGVMHTYVF